MIIKWWRFLELNDKLDLDPTEMKKNRSLNLWNECISVAPIYTISIS